MSTKSLTQLIERLIGRSDPLPAPSFPEMALTLLWLAFIATIVVVFWPWSGGTFIYEGF